MNTSSSPNPPKKPKFELPVWIPYPSSWLRAIILVFFTIALGILVRIAGFWGFVIASVMDDFTHFVRYVGLAFLTALLIYAYAHNFLVGKSPKNYPVWLPSLLSLWEGAYALVVILLSTLIAFFCVFPFYEESLSYWHSYSQEVDEVFAAWFGGVWFIVALYFYQLEYLWHKKTKVKRQQTPNSTTDETKISDVDPLEFELNRLRTGEELTQSPAKPSKSQTSRDRQPRKTTSKKVKYLLYFLIAIFLTWAVFLATNLPKFLQPQPASITLPSSTPTQDPFNKAVNEAMNAATLAQTAQTPAEWLVVAESWQAAIAWMQAVPADHPQYATAQQKAVEYQPNLQYAQQNSASE